MRIEAIGQAEQGERSDMQDTYFVRHDGRVMAVFDGHGPDGGVAAERAVDFFSDTWDRYTAMNRTEQFIECDREMADLDGGTTATVAEVVSYGANEHVVVVHNVGDSPAYVVDPARDGQSPIEISAYHNVDNMQEANRMEREGVGVFGRYFEVSRVGLLMVSRALGDHACRGVIARPSKYVERLAGGQLIVVASDGVLAEKTQDGVLEQIIKSDRDGKSLDKMTREAIDLAVPQTHDNATIILGKVSF